MLSFLTFFAQCHDARRIVDIYTADGRVASAVVREGTQEPTVVEAEIRADGAIHFAPAWGVADFAPRDCKKGAPPNGVIEFPACLYWLFGGADIEHATIADLVKRKEAIACEAHVQCETPDPGEPGTCLKMRLLEKIIPVDSDKMKFCSVR